MKIIKFASIFIMIVLMISGCKDEFKNKQEARGVWMSRFDYAKKNADEVKNIIKTSFENARKTKMNMVFFQIRGNGDAFYKSDFEPWSSMLTGNLGQDPGWDPLQYAIETAHELGLELHAWINTFPAWRSNDLRPDESFPRHVLLEHPDWIVCDKNGNPMAPSDGYISLSPGINEVRKHVIKVVMDIVRKYNIDGVHFDYIRYPEGSNSKGYSHDKISLSRFKSIEGNPKNLDWENWQREQISDFVRNVYDSINNVKPWIKISSSVIGNFKRSGWNGYNIVYQDANTWIKENKIDFIVPMAYKKRGNTESGFEVSLEEWKPMLKTRDIYPGLGAYLAIGKNGWGWDEIWQEIKLLRESGFPGIVFFAVGSLSDVWKDLGDNQFQFWANIPSFAFKGTEKPEKPINIIASFNSENMIRLTWAKVKNDKNNQPHYYNIYRSKSDKFNFNTAENIIFVTPLDVNEFIDKNLKENNYFYCVTALNRNNIEGDHSEIICVGKSEVSVNK